MSMRKHVFTDPRSITIQELDHLARINPGYILILRFKNTKNLDAGYIRALRRLQCSNRINIQIVGGYDDERIRNYQESTNRLQEDNVYTLDEMSGILTALDKIESGINPIWDQGQKLLYFISKLGDQIIYHPLYEYQPSKSIRSLTGLISGKTVCAGYALILKELCDRNGIECDYVEGATTIEDSMKDYRTHAWNIARINGNYIPIDLTWNASKKNTGQTMVIDDIANVNSFVKSHFPGRYERIQNYEQTLSNINGEYLRAVNNFINKDYSTFHRHFESDNPNDRFVVVQDKTRLRGNGRYTKYIYYRVDRYGRLEKPVALYSKTNVAYIVEMYKMRKKWKQQLAEERQKPYPDYEKCQKLIENIEKTELASEAYPLLDKLLFSRENVNAAITRGDHYLGRIAFTEDEKHVDGVEISHSDIKTLREAKQKTFVRNDGTSFVLEANSVLNFDGTKVKRYTMHEMIDDEMHTNTIFSDQDLLTDNRYGIANYLLSRSRIDRLQKESNGYIGYLNSNDTMVRTSQLTKIFRNDIAHYFHFNSKIFEKYHPDITFDEMRRLAKTYQNDSDFNRVYNRYTGRELTDNDLKLRVQFSLAWLRAAGIRKSYGEPVAGYNCAFNSDNEELFDYLYQTITRSVNTYGNINATAILDDVIKNNKYKQAEDIVIRLFGNKYNAKYINRLFRLQNPSAVRENEIIHFTLFGSNKADAYNKLEQFRREKAQELRSMLEVVERGGKVVVTHKYR